MFIKVIFEKKISNNNALSTFKVYSCIKCWIVDINSSTVVVNSDDNITLLCPVGTLSLTSLIWTRTCNGLDKPLPETSSHWDMAFPNLMIQDIQWFHYGTFRCYAVSYFENVTYSFDVNVIHIQSKLLVSESRQLNDVIIKIILKFW